MAGFPTALFGHGGGSLGCDFSRPEGPSVFVWLDNYGVSGTLDIPLDYILSPNIKEGGVYKQLNLLARKSDFTPYPRLLLRRSSDDQLKILVTTNSEFYHPPRPPPSKAYENGRLLANGLFHVRIHSRDILLGREGKKNTDVILCDDLDKGPCDHFFDVGRFYVKTSYSLAELDDWQKHRNKVSAFIACFAARARGLR